MVVSDSFSECLLESLTCLFYVQRAECEHSYFVRALMSDGKSPALGSTPSRAKVGRKRKGPSGKGGKQLQLQFIRRPKATIVK